MILIPLRLIRIYSAANLSPSGPAEQWLRWPISPRERVTHCDMFDYAVQYLFDTRKRLYGEWLLLCDNTFMIWCLHFYGALSVVRPRTIFHGHQPKSVISVTTTAHHHHHRQHRHHCWRDRLMKYIFIFLAILISFSAGASAYEIDGWTFPGQNLLMYKVNILLRVRALVTSSRNGYNFSFTLIKSFDFQKWNPFITH